MEKRIWLIVIFLLICAAALPAPLRAAPYYEGKVLRIIVGWEAGAGGYDRMARIFARHLPKHIPGKPSVVVENMSGAGSIIAANYIYNIAKPDGLTIATVSRGLPYAQLTKVEGVKFDMMKYAWVGSASVESTVLTLRTDLSYKSIEDLQKAKKEIFVSGVGPGSPDVQFPLLLNMFLGLRLNIVTYQSSAAGMLAIERKEVDGKAGSYSSFKIYIDRGLVHPILRGRASEPGIEKLPVDEDLAPDPKGKIMLAMRSVGDQVGRPYVAPPKTPPEVMGILREAFAKVTQDPELKEDAMKSMLNFSYVPAEECLKVLNRIFQQPEEIVQEFGKYIKF